MPANETVMRIVGMSRSGNHAVIDWLLTGLPGRWCFLNCVEPKCDPWQTARPMEDGARWRTNDASIVPETEARGLFASKDWLVMSQEDTFLKAAFGDAGVAVQDSALGGGQRRLDVLILRDPYNLFASRRRGCIGSLPDHIAVRMWMQHAKAFLARRSAPGRPLVPVSYNLWACDPAYRKELAAELGLLGSPEAGLGVARCAGGSSFDGYSLAEEPGRMRVFDRWRHYADCAEFSGLFSDEMAELSTRIFGVGARDIAARPVDPPEPAVASATLR